MTRRTRPTTGFGWSGAAPTWPGTGVVEYMAEADPTDRTMQILKASQADFERKLDTRAEIRQREHATLQELIETRLTDGDLLSTERVASIRREININEAHRLELKSDSEKTLNTATIAAEKAVQAALAAAEKARDQQTIASQLATTKAEEASKEQMKQQGETFTTAISGLNVGFNDVKSMLGELRAERRGGQDQVNDSRANNTQSLAVAGLFSGVIVAAVMKMIG